MSNSFPVSVGQSLITTGSTAVYTEAAITAFVNNTTLPSTKTISDSPVAINRLLRDMGKKVFAFGSNGLKTYEFRHVQIINGKNTEGVKDDVTGYVCVWAASGTVTTPTLS